MNGERKEAWLRIFAAFVQVWTWLEPTVERIRVWDGALSDLEPLELLEGASWILSNHSGHQPPTPGELRDAVHGRLQKVAVKDVAGRIVRWELVRRHDPEQPASRAALPEPSFARSPQALQR